MKELYVLSERDAAVMTHEQYTAFFLYNKTN
jgi:hypothetical protein